ncbi:hypothetical protein [Salinicola peritrichatus]|uniref:hypothetical protein n=1 Tax=Salinicola peritrichatus TaxID=1267424 RepID=UPI000DA258A5|nr:hypothetical protein [Salinicola peritrichatus]
MTLPQRVREQADAAARHYEQLGNTDNDTAQAGGDVPAPGDVNNDDNGQDSGDDAQRDGEDRRAEHQPETEQGAAYWQHRFNVSEGRLRSVTDENRTLKETIKQHEGRIAELERSGGQQSGNLTPGEVTKLEKLREEYGSDLVDAITQLVEHKLPKGNANDERVERLEQQLQQNRQDQQDDLEARFWQRLHQLVPNLQEINADQGFLDWLAGIDRFAGVPRQQLLEDARTKLDAERVAGIFDAYSSGAQPPDQSGGAGSGKREIPEEQIQPRQSRSTQTPAGAKVWTRDEIQKFYKDRREGRYSREEGERVEADIFAAQQQGRVQ